MRLLFVFSLILAVTTVARSQEQEEVMTQTTRDRINLGNLSIPGSGVLFGLKGPAGKVIGNVYVDTVWQAGNVKFYGKLNATTDSLAGVPVRLDLMANEVDVRTGAQDIRVAKASTVRYVDMNNRVGTSSRYINVREYRGDADALSGLFEQVATGKLDLLQHPSVYVRRANYNMALNVGTKDDEIVKKTDWYVAKNRQATKFSPTKKALLDLMSDRRDQIEAYLKKDKPDLKSRAGLIAVVAYYNGL
ncbi:hypothetical protein [Spirosoma arcticum]